MAKLKQNVIYHPEPGVTKLAQIGDDVPKDQVDNPDVFEDEDDPVAEGPARTRPDPPRPVSNLDELKVSELREIADERGVDLTGASQKAEIIERLRGAELV